MMISDYNSMRPNSSISSLSMEERRTKSSFNFTSARSFIFSERYSLKALHLPPSIENIDDLPNGLWNWIHTQDSVSQESSSNIHRNRTKIIFNNEKLVNGKLIQSKYVMTDNSNNTSEDVKKKTKNRKTYKCPLPRPLPPRKNSFLERSQSLRDLPFPRSISNLYSKSSLLSLNSLSSVSTKIDEPFTNSSLYIQAVELQGKFSSKVSAIFCEVEVGKRKYRTDPVKLEKNTTLVQIREGFLFDVPSTNFKAIIKVYGIQSPQSKSIFSTLFNNNKKSIIISRSYDSLFNSMTDLKSMFRENLSESIEVYLGEVSFQLTNIKLLQLSGVYPLSISSSSINLNSISSLKASKILKSFKSNSNKVPKMVIQMGIFNDELSKIELQKIPSNISNINLQYENFISFLINSNQRMIWRRYWVQILNNYMYIYDSEYKNRKDPITRLNLSFIKSIKKTDPEQIYVNNCITIEFQSNYLSSETGEELIENMKTIPLQFEHIDGNEILIRDLVKSNESWSNWNLNSLNEGFRIYCYADSKNDVVEWVKNIKKAKEIHQ